MRRSWAIVYWVLLLAPALALGAGAFRLLRREQARLHMAVEEARAARARALGGTVEAAVLDAESEVFGALAALDAAGRPEALRRLEREHPLVRAVFAWRREPGLLLPRPDGPLTRAEAGFVRRFAPLFSGAEPWPEDGRTADAASPAPARAKLRGFAVSQSVAAGPGDAPRGGWIPWFEANRLHLLGWLRRDGEPEVYGAELELAAVLSRVLPVLDARPLEGEGWAVLDGEGRPLWQAGDVAEGAVPRGTVAVGAGLPHWQVAWYAGPAAGAAGRRGFLVVAGLLVGVLLAAIVSGGSLLFREARRGLREAQLKTSFVANVSHELKSPLTTIRMYAELLAEDRVRDEARRREYLGVISAESQRLGRLVNNVLDFSRLEQRRRPYRPEDLDLAALVEGVLDAQRVRAEAAGLSCAWERPPGPCRARTDRDASEQIVLNLVDNAIKYAAAGRDLRLALAAHPAGGWALCVGDRGPGVPRAERERVFEKFHRLDASLTTRTPGTGLGLSIARRLARDLGGDVTCRGREGGGAEFVVRWPEALP